MLITHLPFSSHSPGTHNLLPQGTATFQVIQSPGEGGSLLPGIRGGVKDLRGGEEDGADADASVEDEGNDDELHAAVW